MSQESLILSQCDHRPFALPEGPWVMRQSWCKLLFAHWEVPLDLLRRQVPAQFEIDLYEGRAYVAVVPFAMKDVRPRFMPAVPWLSAFLEMNLRTYVRFQGVPGVYFFSLDAANPVAVALARRWFHLPYYNAAMTLTEGANESEKSDQNSNQYSNNWYSYESRRCHEASPALHFKGRYRPLEEYAVPQGSLVEFLTERYCLYTLNGRNQVCRGNIHHLPWSLNIAEAEIEINTMGEPYGFDLSARPLLHYAEAIDTVEWPLNVLR